MSLLKLNQYVLKVLSFMILLACAVQFISFGKETLTFFNLYSFILIALPAAYLLLTQESNEFTGEANFLPKDYAIIGLFFVVQLAMRIYGLERFSLWIDEVAQMKRSTAIPFIESSGLHFQPPLDYILQKLTVTTFGVSDFTIRLNTAVFSVVASTLFFTLLKRITGSYIVALILSCLMIFEPWFFKYSFDARPLATGYLTLVLFLVSFIHILKPEGTLLKTSEFRHITCAAVLFTLSVGYQPIFVLGSIIFVLGVCILIAYKNRDHRNYYINLIYPLGLSLLLFIPLQIKIYLDSINLVTSTSVVSKVFNFNLNNFDGLYQVYGVYFIFLFSMLLLITLLRQFKKKAKLSAFEANFFVSVCLLFFLVSVIVFSIPLNYRLAVHYVIFTLPLLILSAAYLYKTGEECFSVSLHKRFYKLGFLFVIILAWPQFNLMYMQHPKTPMPREDLKQAYSIVLKESSDRDYVTSLSFSVTGWSPMEINLGSGPYYVLRAMRDGSKTHADIVRNQEIPVLAFYSVLKENQPIANLYVLFHRGFEQVNVDFDVLKDLNNVQLTYLENILLLKIQNTSGDLKKEWFKVIDKLAEKTETPKSWTFQVLLAQKYLLLKDRPNFEKAMDQIEIMIQHNDNRPVIDKIIKALETEGQKVFYLKN